MNKRPIVFILFGQQLAIVKAAARRLTNSLYDIKQFVQADLFDSELDAATELMKSGYLRPAGMMAGVVMERHLAQVCENHGIKFRKKKPTITDFNDSLKEKEVISVSEWRRNQYFADLRNLCAHHNKEEKEITTAQVEELIDGTDKIIKTLS